LEKPGVLIESHFGGVVTGNCWPLLTLVAFGSVITCAGLPTVSVISLPKMENGRSIMLI
jgi:hypothetical protein